MSLLPFSSSRGANQAPTADRLPTPSQTSTGPTRSGPPAPAQDENAAPAASIEPARKKRKRESTASKSDAQVWELSDEEILAASKASWNSVAYDHYDVSLHRRSEAGTNEQHIIYRFECKHKHPDHSYTERAREKSGQGTSNLLSKAIACDEARGIQTRATASAPKYSVAAHRTIIAMRTATSHRPFNSVHDPYYLQEVELLRPGTVVPSATTVSKDVKLLYLELSKQVRAYFTTRNRPVHGVIDGWSSPLGSSYLGAVISWYDAGKIHRAILEFIKLTESHTGKYLAKVFVDCLERFGLKELLLFLNMDNAGNCDTTAVEAQVLIPTFGGAAARLRCILHILNLIAKASNLAFIQFFFKEMKRKKAIKVGNGTKRSRVAPTAVIEEEPEEAVAEEGDLLTQAEEEIAQVLDDRNTSEPQVDDAQEVHDSHIARSIREKAIALMKKRKVVITPEENRAALGIFPKVAGLAKKVHDSGTIANVFDELVDSAKSRGAIETDKTALDRRCPTRWNSDLQCLDAHVIFKPAVQQLTAAPDLKLKSYALTDPQWKLLGQISAVLGIFDDMTMYFSQAETLLIADAIGALEDVLTSLTNVMNDEEMPNVIRVAAAASKLVCEKYFSLTGECEVYAIAIVMTPNKKLNWFHERNWSEDKIKEIKDLVVSRWEESYKQYAQKIPTVSTPSVSTATPSRAARWKAVPVTTPVHSPDSIQAYLAEPPVSTSVVQTFEGPIGYWFRQEGMTPSLARMGSDYCSAPAASVDSERAFSIGRRKLGFMQHNTADQTFRASMAVGSWDGTPLFPDLGPAIKIIEASMARGGTEA